MSLTLTTRNLTIIEGEPRVLDTDLAEALGFDRPRKIRDLIKRHFSAISCLAEVKTKSGQTSSKGGRPSVEYWLDRKQALYICAKSGTDTAAEITVKMVEVFDDFLSNGKPVQTAQSQRFKPARYITKAERQRENQIKWKKRQFADIAIDLDELGVDVLAIDMMVVIGFGRAMRLQWGRK